jgi:hypothetical protein
VSRALRVARYRFGATFGRRGGGYLTIVLLVGAIGGPAMASVASGRRTGSSYATYLASTNPTDVSVVTDYDSPALGVDNGYDPSAIARIDHLPLVRRAGTEIGFDGNLQVIKGAEVHQTAGESFPSVEGSPDGQYSVLDRATVTAGRPLGPVRTAQAVVNAQAATELRVHVGSVLELGFATDAQENADTDIGNDLRMARITVVGIVQFNDQVIEDQADPLGGAYVLLSPELTRQLESQYATYSGTALQVSGGARNVPAVLAKVARIVPRGLSGSLPPEEASVVVGKADRALRPEAIALEVFGALAGLAALVIGGQAVVRQVRAGAGDRLVLRSLGAGPGTTMVDGMFGVVIATLAGAVLAVGVAVSLSPLSPLGSVRPIDPAPGFSADGLVLGTGAAILVVALTLVGLVATGRERADRAAGRARVVRRGESGVVGAAADAGLSVPAVTGLRSPSNRGPGVTRCRSVRPSSAPCSPV